MFQSSLVQLLQGLAVPLCCFCVWTLMALFVWSLWVATRDGIKQLKRLHQIPCSRCAYFTRDYRLKCTVHPCKALSEDAINCLDFEPVSERVVIVPTCRQPCSGTQLNLNWKGQR